jgi:hypothetical protein
MMTNVAQTLRRGPRTGILRAAVNNPDTSCNACRARAVLGVLNEEGPVSRAFLNSGGRI